LIEEQMNAFFLVIHQEAKPIDATTKDCRRLLKALISK
jgi:hypothetical protein